MAKITRAVPLTPTAEKLTLSQRRAAEIFAMNDVYDMTIAEVAKECGVSVRSIYRWKQDRDFIAYQNEIAETVMEDFLAETYNVIKRLARSGRSEHSKLKAVELVLKNRGKLQEIQKVEATIKDERTDETIEAEIEEMRRQLEELQADQREEE